MTNTADTGTGQSITWIFDAEGQRVQKSISGGSWTFYIHDALGQLAAEYNNQGISPACVTCYLTYDMIGTVRMITNESQQLIARHDYVAFGEEIPNGSAGRVGNFGYPSDVTQGFTGQEADGGTAQLDFFNARHLAAVTGAFAQPDPGNAGADITNPQAWNAYAYALGDPLGTTDPMGLFGLGQVHDDSGDDGGGDEDGDNPYEAPPCTACDSTGVYFKVTVTDHSRKASPINPLPPKKVLKIGNYPNLDCDGYRAARSVLRQTTKVGHEFGGFLYKNSNGRYSYSYPPVQGTPTSIPTLFTTPQALVSRIVGWFHDHPLVPGYNNDMFSASDLLDTRKTGPGYLGTATGRILKLSIDSQGYPHVYVG